MLDDCDRTLDARDDARDERSARRHRRAPRAPHAAGKTEGVKIGTRAAIGVKRRFRIGPPEEKRIRPGPSRIREGGVPNGIRTRVSEVKIRGPGPLDDGDQSKDPTYPPPIRL